MKHCIIIKYNETVSPELKQALIPEIQALFDNTVSIEGIHKVTLKPNVINRANRYDLIIEIEMNPSALPFYDDCEWHHIWKNDYSKYLASKAIIDID